VTDNGVGFLDDKASPSRLGFASMQERVRLLKGNLIINSRPAQGTTVRAWIPIEKNDER